MKNKIIILLLGAAITACVSTHAVAMQGNSPPQPWYQNIYDNFQVRGDVLLYGILTDVEDSNLNPFNILGIPTNQFEGIFRPDFFMALDDERLVLSCKPRFSAKQTSWDDGVYQYKSSEADGDAYINEWQAKYGISQEWFVIGGRENLQWGPSYLLSPSNPFLGDNGRNNPYLELPGLDYLRAVWVPNTTWSFSVIANVGEGQRESLDKFRNIYAYKIDFTGFKKYASAIVSKKEEEKPEIGFFGGITGADYLLLHMEGNFSSETDKMDILAGGTYTFENGSALTLEYFFQGNGCTTGPIEQSVVPGGLYEELKQRFDGFEGTADELLNEIEALNISVDTSSLIRKNYIMTQYVKPRIRDVITLTGRWIYDADDKSSRIIGIGNWEIDNHLALIAVGNVFTGGSDTEFGSLLNHSAMLGVTYSF